MDRPLTTLPTVEALAVLFAASGLILARRRPRAAQALGALVLALQGSALLIWLAEVNLGLDASRWIGSPQAFAPTATLALVLLGSLIVARGGAKPERPLWSPLVGVVVLLLAAAGVVPTLAEAPGFTAWGELTRVPVRTSIVLLFLAKWALWPSLRTPPPRTPRLPLLLGAAGTLVAIAAWQLLLVQRGAWIQVTASSTADTTAALLDQQLLVHALALRVMAEEWEDPEAPPIAEWTVDAERTSAELPAFLGFVWIGPLGDPDWSWFPEGEPPARQASLRAAAMFAAEAASQGSQDLVEVVNAGSRRVLALPMPMVMETRGLGRMVGLLEGDRLIEHLVPPEIRDDFALVVSADDAEVSRHGWREDLRYVSRETEVLGARWRVVLWPDEEWLERVRSGLPEVFLVFGVGLALALALGADMAREARHRAAQLASALAELRASHELLEQRVAQRTDDLRRANDELARTNEDLQQFAGIASHDLKAPLHTVSLHLGVLARRLQGQVGDAEARLLDNAGLALRRMGKLIDDLLEFARSGSQTRQLEVARLDAVLDRALEALDAAVAESGATITRRDLDLEVRVDAAQIGRVFQNLIGNALKYRRDVPVQVEIGARPEGGMARVWVRDNGVGVEPDVQERIFVMFDRGTGARVAPGTGIGLATCKRIVLGHGGDIGVESTPGQGSTFWFTLPLATASPPG